MSWTADIYIGEMRPWPDAVRVVRGDTDETMLYTVTPLPHFWTHDGTLHIEPRKLPERIDVTLPDERGREVYSARVRRFVPERTCRVEREPLGIHTDDGWVDVCSECRVPIDPDCDYYCPNCGAKVVDA